MIGKNNVYLTEINYVAASLLRSLAGRSELLDSFWIFTAETGSYIVPVLLVLLFLKNGESRQDSLFVFTATILGIGLAHIVQQLYIHPRPFEIYDTLLADATGDSFPSQHASTLFPFSLALLNRGRKRLGALILAWTILNSLSRMVVGYHFPVDILAGAVIGVMAVWALSQHQDKVKDLSKRIDRIQDSLINL